MTIETIDYKRLIHMYKEGAKALSEHAKTINALNVFPVPDGDTGTNMTLTIESGVEHLDNGQPQTVGQASGLFAKGLLMGARGNSGVILSQLFRGFSKTLESYETMTASLFANALESGVDTAYQAVIKPVEGTILTVAKDAAKAASKKAKKTDDLIRVVESAVTEAKQSLQRTPELLPILKEVGVVDSGGQGLVMIYQGFLSGLTGEPRPFEADDLPQLADLVHVEHHRQAQAHINTQDIKYGYCTEFMVRLNKNDELDESSLKHQLSRSGDSLVVVADEDLLKVHIHTEKPGDMLSLGQTYGDLVKVKIDNMREQHADIVREKDRKSSNGSRRGQKEKKKYGVVTVAVGEGLKTLFKNQGATIVIEGGQTMNPSTEDLLLAIEQANAENVFVLPNNSNILMAADQAAKVAKTTVRIIPSKTIAQGLSALLSFNPEATSEQNVMRMETALAQVKSGQVTRAVRDTVVEGVAVQKDDFIGITDEKITVSVKDRMEALDKLIDHMVEDEDEMITLIYGEKVTAKEAQNMKKMLNNKYQEVEVEIHEGLQPLYDYFISVE